MSVVSRRNFIAITGTTGVAFWLGLSAKGDTVKAASLAGAKNFTPYILIEPGGSITIYNTKPEMGQGTLQSFPALIAEELEVSLDKIIIKQSNGEKELGPGQRAGGSSSIRTNYTAMRKVGAAAREVLVLAAANKWGVPAAACYADDGNIVHAPTKRILSYGDLAEDASKLELPKEPQLKDPKDFKILGKVSKRQDVPLKTNGTAEFGLDAKVAGMLYASVEHSPIIGGTLKSFDSAAAMKFPGVEKVVSVDRIVGKYTSTGVAVIANSYWAATQARKMLNVVWDYKGFENFNSVQYEKHLRELSKQEGLLDKNIGNVAEVPSSSQNTLEAFYETPLIAHHTLEPMNCIAQVKGDRLEIWTSTQVASSVTGNGANDLHKHVGFLPGNIKLHNKFIGGGFGRRLYLDYIIEAVNIAKQTDKPVKVVWSREDTTEQGPFRPMTFSKLKGSLFGDGKVAALEHKVISPSISESTRLQFDNTKVDGTMVEGIGEQAYEIPNLKTSYVRADFHIPVAAWRSVTSSTLAFPHECFIDELAHKAKADPLNFRMTMLTKPSDTKRVLQKIRELSGWDKKPAKGKGKGIAVWEFFAGLCAQVVEVTHRADGTIKIDRVVAVIDLGEVVNPDNVKNQVEGAIIMALGAATKPGITFKNGKTEQHNFYDNPQVRINEAPPIIEVHILAEGGKVKGVGEPGLPAFAPALANAIFAATGKRIRKMPFDLKV